MSNSRRPELCEICDKKSFLLVLKCSHKICLDCKVMIKKVEQENCKCPFCRIPFQGSLKVIDYCPTKQKQEILNIDSLIADLNWEIYSSDKTIEYNSDLHEELAWKC